HLEQADRGSGGNGTMRAAVAVIAALRAASCAAGPQYDVVIRHGTVYDCAGAPGVVEDVAIAHAPIAARGTLDGARHRCAVDAPTIRAYEIGYDNRAPTPEERTRMRAHVRRAMDDGAMGLTTALIYTPAVFAKTDELVELAKVAAESGGMYISHMRSEGDRLLEAIDETLTIARQAHIRAEIYHLKAGGQSN